MPGNKPNDEQVSLRVEALSGSPHDPSGGRNAYFFEVTVDPSVPNLRGEAYVTAIRAALPKIMVGQQVMLQPTGLPHLVLAEHVGIREENCGHFVSVNEIQILPPKS